MVPYNTNKNNIHLGGGKNQHPLAKDVSSTDNHLTKISGNSKEANTTSSAKEPDGTAGKIISTDWQLDPMIIAQGRKKRKTRGISVWWSKSIITSSLRHFHIILYHILNIAQVNESTGRLQQSKAEKRWAIY